MPERSTVTVTQNIFAADLHEELLDVAASQSERKRRYDFKQETPGSLIVARDVLVDSIEARVNSAIVKRYRLDDDPPSGAYRPHPDPDVYSGNDIELYSLDGEAWLFSGVPTVSERVHCLPRTLVVMDPLEPHWVTPPLNPEGVRHIIFFGYDSSA